jgi:hypothetical protein
VLIVLALPIVADSRAPVVTPSLSQNGVQFLHTNITVDIA